LTVIATENWTSKVSALSLKQRPSGVVFEPDSDRFYIATHGGEWAKFLLSNLSPNVNDHRAPIGAVANNDAALALVYSQRKWVEGMMRSQGAFSDTTPQSGVSLLRSGKSIVLLGGSPYVYAAAVSPDGGFVATACGDGEINVWNVTRPNQPYVWMGHPGAATSVAWISDGRFLVTTGMDGALRLWRSTDYQLAGTLVSPSDIDYVIASEDGSYTATRGGLASVVFRVGGRALPFDQFDLSLNRPDRVHGNLGYAYDDLIDGAPIESQSAVGSGAGPIASLARIRE
jgi:WD40 repeat protein